MAVTQQQRQSQLFPSAENWQTLYTAFTEVNFNAYDFNSIRAALINYIRINYPEDFNDWTENSELVAIIELLSYLGTSIAMRMDLNTRENFIDTAQRRESIFRLARLLSYQPQRCLPATGLLKITAINANQDIYDSAGNNLNGQTIIWNDLNNQDWQEQFTLVLNASLNSNNPIGSPIKSGTVNGIATQLYELNNTAIPTSVVPFTASVNGVSTNFELVNPNFIGQNDPTTSILTSSGYFYETTPNPVNSWNLIYQNDGNGFGSANTGYFLMFKQGTLSYTDYQLDLSIPNRVIDVSVNNINNSDVFVLTVDNTGAVITNWTQVPSVNGFNVIYNSVSQGVRNIYSVITRDADGYDQISIRFADGSFGNVPVGLIRVWYRVSNNQTFQIRPNDISNSQFSFGYYDNFGNTYSLSITANLQYTVDNAQASQTNTQIKLAAGQVYYTQDRMVNGEDYNLFPLQNSAALKINAINRTYSGQSMYIDINDPTGTYQDTLIIADDGILYEETTTNQQIVNLSSVINTGAIVANYIQPMVNGSLNQNQSYVELQNFYYANYSAQPINNIYWHVVNVGSGSTSGAFYNNYNSIQAVGNTATAGTGLQYVSTGSVIQFSSNGQTLWSTVLSVVNNGLGVNSTGILANGLGAITLDAAVANNASAIKVYPAYRTTFTNSEISSITQYLNTNQTFGLRFDNSLQQWIVITNGNLSNSSTFSLQYAGNTSNNNLDASWLVKLVYANASWTIITRSQRYVMESASEVSFYNSNSDKVVDINTGATVKDTINVLGINSMPDSNAAIGTDYIWIIQGQEIYPDGYSDPTSVRVTFNTNNGLNTPSDPDAFNTIVSPTVNPNDKLVFWQQYTTSDGYQYYSPVEVPDNRIYATPPVPLPPTDNTWVVGETAYVVSTNKVYQYAVNNVTNVGYLVDVTSQFKIETGRNNLKFIWKHYASSGQRIDPAVSNIIDIYVLTTSYDTNIRNWISTNGTASTLPTPPTSDQLRSQFSSLEQYKMMSDQIIWHPVSYKLLFGSQADAAYQVSFAVVPAFGTTLTNNEIASAVINVINSYFALANWDFGQTFYYTEMASYIHVQLATIIGSIVMIPTSPTAVFGDLFEIPANPNEILISCARVSDVQIVSSITESLLGITNNLGA